MQPFRPSAAATVNISVSGSSQRVQIPGRPESIRIVNDGTATVWCNFGDGTVTAATSTGFPVRSGVTEVLRFKPGGLEQLHVAAIAAGSTGTIYFTPGDGV